MAQQTLSYGWEDGVGTVLGMFPTDGQIATNVGAPDPVYAGERALKLVDNAASGTPQGYAAWIIGLQDGDQVTGSVWRYDTTPGTSPSGRIWGHYTNGTIDDYAGSAGGQSDYGPGTGWDQTSWTWTFDAASDPTRTGLVIELRTYSSPGDTVWFDDISVTAPDHATIIFAPEPASLLLVLGGLALVRRRR
jgi:hypothetical protein